MKITKQQMKDAIRGNYNLTGIYDMSDIQRKHVGHFFDKGAMRFFNSRLTNIIYCSLVGVYFVTSEAFDYNSPRLFTVRRLDLETGKIDTIGEFNELTKSQADSLALKSAYNECSNDMIKG